MVSDVIKLWKFPLQLSAQGINLVERHVLPLFYLKIYPFYPQSRTSVKQVQKYLRSTAVLPQNISVLLLEQNQCRTGVEVPPFYRCSTSKYIHSTARVELVQNRRRSTLVLPLFYLNIYPFYTQSRTNILLRLKYSKLPTSIVQQTFYLPLPTPVLPLFYHVYTSSTAVLPLFYPYEFQ